MKTHEINLHMKHRILVLIAQESFGHALDRSPWHPETNLAILKFDEETGLLQPRWANNSQYRVFTAFFLRISKPTTYKIF